MHNFTEPIWIFFDVAAKGFALMAATFACSVMLRKASAALRHLLWSLTAAGLLVLPLLSWTLTGWTVSIPSTWLGTAQRKADFVEKEPTLARPLTTSPSSDSIRDTSIPIARVQLTNHDAAAAKD